MNCEFWLVRKEFIVVLVSVNLRFQGLGFGVEGAGPRFQKARYHPKFSWKMSQVVGMHSSPYRPGFESWRARHAFGQAPTV